MKNKKLWYVYMHTNKVNDKKYIGITGQERYWDRWRSDGSGYKTQVFGRAIDKYGWDSFSHEILEVVDNEDIALIQEQYYIEKYKSDNPEYGYNISCGGVPTITGLYNLPSISIPVYQYGLDGVFIAEYPSMMEAERQTGIDNSAICACCKGVHAFTKDYIWSYEKYDSIPPIDKEKLRYELIIQKQEKPVYQYSLDGAFITSHNSLSRASESTGVDFRLISECCLKKNGRKMAGGFMWTYDYNGEKIFPYKKEFATKAVELYDLNGVLLNTYNSIKEAIIDLNLKQTASSNISSCLTGRKDKAYGYVWKYAT